MKNHRHPWNLRQIFGSQPVGCVAGSPRPEARIAARVIPAQSSRWTFRGQGDNNLATWRLGDLPTCRPADLPTWRPADLVVDDQRDSSPRTLLRPQLRRFVHLQQGGQGFSHQPRLENTPSLPRPESSLGIIFQQSPPSPLGIAKNQNCDIRIDFPRKSNSPVLKVPEVNKYQYCL